jgi:hypothetical protein
MAIEQTPIEIGLREPRGRRRDFFTVIWLFGWGMATAIALGALVVTSQTQTATERLRSIFAVNEPSAVARMPPRVSQLEAEMQILSEQMRAMKADRERLAGRIALLESSIDDMTGTIKRQADATAALAAKTPPPAPSSLSTTASVNPPAVSPPAITPVPASRSAAVAPEAKPETATTSTVALPSGRTEPSQAAEPEATATAPQNEFGLDLGGGATLDAVRQRWVTVKANFGPLLSGLHPRAAPDRRQGKTGYRLVVGPLPNNPAAAGLCAHFSAAHTACRAVKFEGEQIAQR